MRSELHRIAILNRGEAATRCLRAIRELRLEEGSDLVGIALYTDPDRAAPFVAEADVAVGLGPALRPAVDGALRPAYLDQERVLAALRAARADAVWPGWGFLAEAPDFVARLEASGVLFLGPRSETLRNLGDKVTAKRIAEAAGVAVLPWSEGSVTRESVDEAAARLGFPLLIKAAAGGGGRGIRRVEGPEEFLFAFESATREAEHAFGDGRVFLEKPISRARHLEVQMIADADGTILPVGIRDCSIQRRLQKLLEEAPPSAVPSSLLEKMREASVRLLQTVGYVGVATCEYLLDPDGNLWFLEVNPRLQVEHGVTELLTGFDLVKWQIRVARGDRLSVDQPVERGHAIEARVCAEDPATHFAPSPGRIALLELPSGPGVRVDSGVGQGGTIPAEFDSMIAKVMAYGSTREEARARLVRALTDLRIVVEGGATNKGFLLDVLRHPDFRAAACHTEWLEEEPLELPTPPIPEALIVAAILTYERGRRALRYNFYSEVSRGRPRTIPPSTGREVELVYGGVPYRLRVFAIGGWSYRVYLGDRVSEVVVREQGPRRRQLVSGGRSTEVLFSESDVELRIEVDGHTHRIFRDLGGKVLAPAPALVIEVVVSAGDPVSEGQRLGLLEAMKTETAFHAPVAGTVRDVCVRPGSRVAGGDVLLIIDPVDEHREPSGLDVLPILELPPEPDPLDHLFHSESGLPDLFSASQESGASRTASVGALRTETRRILMGYDVNPERAERLLSVLDASVEGIVDGFLAELAQLARAVALFADIETLFSRAPTRGEGDALGPSSDARMSMYMRRMEAEGAGIDPAFLDDLRRALSHYEIDALTPTDALQRAVLRFYATRTTKGLRDRLMTALLGLLIRLSEHGETFKRYPELKDALEHLGLLRGTVPPTVADLAAQARFHIFERREGGTSSPGIPNPDELRFTLLPAPSADLDLRRRAESLGLSSDEARRIELWRLADFELERLESRFAGVHAFFARASSQPGDARILCFAEILELGARAPKEPDLGRFERRFHEVIEAMRSIQGACDPARRLYWNRLTLFVRPPLVLSTALLRDALRRLAPDTGHLGLEKVVVRLARVDPDAPEGTPEPAEIVVSNPTGTRVQVAIRRPPTWTLAPATQYERRVATARSRGLVYPYEILRLFTSPPDPGRASKLGASTGPGQFVEHDLVDGELHPVHRPPGENTCGVVVGIITTPTRKHPDGMRRVILLGDPTRGMGALAAPECERICAAIDLAEGQDLPMEWVAVSSGALIAMDSGTENLDATARVARRLIEFTDAGHQVNLILPGVNVGAQSYFDALATMGLDTSGILIMLPQSSMVLTGRAALEISGGVAAEDEIGIGGYERIMGPTGQAHFLARDLAEAYRLLLEHYACTYRIAGESGLRRFRTSDPVDRDVTEDPYEGEEGFSTISEIFSSETNPERKRPFSMRSLMRAIVDRDAGWLERWKEWAGAETGIVWDTHVGGIPVLLIGIESYNVPRIGYIPNDGPDGWTARTLFPQSSKKVARALNSASGRRPAVILADLSGFDGSPESMRRGILEYGAEIARAVVRFKGPIVFIVVSRYHGGAYVVFSRVLQDEMRALALRGSYASVIGGPAAAAVVFPRDVRAHASEDPRVKALRAEVEHASDPAKRAARRADLDRILQEVISEKQAELASEFDAIHTVGRALQVGSLESILEPSELRPAIVRLLASEPLDA
jgi:acetyl/propionyl-CoA carboxylase alpha subunit/acetyl-CoA carboxylase carboxyltransferase component